MKARVFWSWWTKPCSQIWENLTCYTLSLSYAKQGGAYCVLYTDKIGAELVKNLPYDEVHVIFDTEIPEWHNPKLFAVSKFIAYQHEPLGSIHIDGDVFLMRKSLIDYIANADFDVMTQHDEAVSPYTTIWNMKLCSILGTDLLGKYEDYKGCWNCGIVCIKNQELKDKYISEYFRLAKKFSEMYPTHKDTWNECLVPDVILEQCVLTYLSQDYKSEQLIAEPTNGENCYFSYSDAKKKGYCHYFCNSKIHYNYQIVDKLKERNEDYLEIIKENYNNYEKNSK